MYIIKLILSKNMIRLFIRFCPTSYFVSGYICFLIGFKIQSSKSTRQIMNMTQKQLSQMFNINIFSIRTKKIQTKNMLVGKNITIS